MAMTFVSALHESNEMRVGPVSFRVKRHGYNSQFTRWLSSRVLKHDGNLLLFRTALRVVTRDRGMKRAEPSAHTYREGKKERAVRAYTVNDESRFSVSPCRGCSCFVRLVFVSNWLLFLKNMTSQVFFEIPGTS